MRKIFIISFIFILCLAGSYHLHLLTATEATHHPVIQGISLEAPSKPKTAGDWKAVREIHANWAAVIPYAFGRADQPAIHFDHPRQWWGERTAGICHTITDLKSLDIQVMVKPHVWVIGEGWAGDFKLNNEEDWLQWEHNYHQYLLHYAHVADSMQADMLCIGTEYRKATVQRPDFWRKLIRDIRQVYHGKLTYAANWDNFHHIPFWDELDYIGVDAYFPLEDAPGPSVEKLCQAWQTPLETLKEVHQKFDKPVIFTEYGYRSIKQATAGHWKVQEHAVQPDTSAQKSAYEALYRSVWHQDWFEGGFIWKWHADHERAGGIDNVRFTPQNKPVCKVIRNYYKAAL